MALYADFELFKSSMKLTVADRDELLNAALEDACRAIDEVTDRQPDGFAPADAATVRQFTAEGRVVRMRDGRRKLLIDEIGSLTDLVVETGDGSTWATVAAGTGYRTAPDNALAKGRPVTALTSASGWGCDLVRVTARWGWPAVPKNIRRAAMILGVRLYRRPGSPEGIAGSSSEGAAVRLARQDPDVQQLLQGYELPGVG